MMQFRVLAAALLAAVLLAPGTSQAQLNSSRYAPPPAAKLSPDLASPWILQLGNRPGRNGRYSLQVSRPAPVVNPAPIVRPAPVQRGWWQRRPQRNSRVYGTTPLTADPVRSNNERQLASIPQQRPVKAQRQEIDPKYEMQLVAYESTHAPGTIVIDTNSKFLYLIEEDGIARRYGVGVGREGFEWKGTEKITRKAEWPDWRPPAEMIEREKKKGRILPAHMPGGPENPLGARALYLGSTLYRIHGTNQPWTIGRALSSGCIRMRNQDVIDLYERVKTGAKVVVT